MKKLAALLALALASTALIACGSSNNATTTTGGETTSEGTSGAATQESEGGGGGGSTVSLEADPGGQITYTTKSATAKAGKVTIDFKNPQALSHDVAIEGSGGETVGKTQLIAESQTSTTVNLKPGKYTFYCTVPGHREAGMEGTLTVK
jgi:plastocyanin